MIATLQSLIDMTNHLINRHPTPTHLLARWHELNARIAAGSLAAPAESSDNTPAAQWERRVLDASAETIEFYLEVLKAVNPELGRRCELEIHWALDRVERMEVVGVEG